MRYEKLIKKIDSRQNKTDDQIYQRKLYNEILEERIRQVNKPVDGWELPNLKKVWNSIDKNEDVMNKNVQLDEVQNVIEKIADKNREQLLLYCMVRKRHHKIEMR